MKKKKAGIKDFIRNLTPKSYLTLNLSLMTMILLSVLATLITTKYPPKIPITDGVKGLILVLSLFFIYYVFWKTCQICYNRRIKIKSVRENGKEQMGNQHNPIR